MTTSSLKLCCENCFRDDFLKAYIKEHGSPGSCSFCEEESEYCLEPEGLRSLFEPVVNLYEPVENFMPTEPLKEWDGDFIWEKLNDDWEIFNDLDYSEQEDMLRAIYADWDYKEGSPQILDSYVEMAPR